MIPALAALGAAELQMFLNDTSPSSAILAARWEPELGVAYVTFHRGGMTYSFPCDYTMWSAYKASPSKGGFWNEMVKDQI